jgi:hypothetical protein
MSILDELQTKIASGSKLSKDQIPFAQHHKFYCQAYPGMNLSQREVGVHLAYWSALQVNPQKAYILEVFDGAMRYLLGNNYDHMVQAGSAPVVEDNKKPPSMATLVSGIDKNLRAIITSPFSQYLEDNHRSIPVYSQGMGR